MHRIKIIPYKKNFQIIRRFLSLVSPDSLFIGFSILVSAILIFYSTLNLKSRQVSPKTVTNNIESTAEKKEIQSYPSEEELEKISKRMNTPITGLIQKDVTPITFKSEKGDLEVSEAGKFGKFDFEIANNSEWAEGEDVSTVISINKNGKKLTSKNYDNLRPIFLISLTTPNEALAMVSLFSGGAHCCTSLVPIVAKNGKIEILKDLFVGNVDSFGQDRYILKDGKLHIVVPDDRFAYFELSYAESGDMFYSQIYRLEDSGFVLVSQNFKEQYEKLYQIANQELGSLDESKIDWSNDDVKRKLFGLQIRRYVLGYMAGHDRAELQDQLKSKLAKLQIPENRVWENLINISSPN